MFKRLLAAIFSGQKAAYRALIYLMTAPFTRAIDSAFGSANQPEQYEEQGLKGLVIIGLSRSGSTIINQVLCRTIPSVYFSNFHSLFPKTAGPYMQRKDLFGRVNMSNGNYYGYTASLYDVNEANLFFEKVFQNEDMENQIIALKSLALQSGMIEERPIIIKNVQYAEQIIGLANDLPGLHFVKVDRELEPMAQSVLRAYHELGYFNPIPRSLEGRPYGDPVEYTALQVIEMEKQLDQALRQIPKERLSRWSYEEFCADPKKHIDQAAEVLGVSSQSEALISLDIELKPSLGQKVSGEEAESLRKYLSQYSNS